jgi:hypothetical protein
MPQKCGHRKGFRSITAEQRTMVDLRTTACTILDTLVGYHRLVHRTSPPTLTRWVLLCTLALCVVAMHHLGAPDSGHAGMNTAMTSMTATALVHPRVDHQPSGDHKSMLHLCLAVMSDLVTLLLFLCRLGAGNRAESTHLRAVSSPAPARAPPWRRGRDLLCTACVLRI